MSYESKTYYSSAQSQIYLNDTLTKEVASISFQYAAQHIPFYGYRSMHFDTVATSRVQVSGQIIINYIANSYFTALIQPEKFNAIEIQKSKYESDTVFNQDDILHNFATMTDEELNVYREYQNQDANQLGNSIMGGVRPEMVATPFEIKVVDNSRFSESQDIASNTSYEDQQVILIKDVFVDSLSRVRSVEQGVIKDAYSFIARTVF